MTASPQPYIKIRYGYRSVFVCHQNGQAEKVEQPVEVYYKNPNYINS